MANWWNSESTHLFDNEQSSHKHTAKRKHREMWHALWSLSHLPPASFYCHFISANLRLLSNECSDLTQLWRETCVPVTVALLSVARAALIGNRRILNEWLIKKVNDEEPTLKEYQFNTHMQNRKSSLKLPLTRKRHLMIKDKERWNRKSNLEYDNIQ